MSPDECERNIAHKLLDEHKDFKSVLKKKTLFCAGSAPTANGINICAVS